MKIPEKVRIGGVEYAIKYEPNLRLGNGLCYGICKYDGLVIENEEEVVEMFAKGIYQVLQDNGARLFDLKTE